ncbi:MAG: lipocalin-like domain-containing protein [Paracoccaceae bacterium]
MIARAAALVLVCCAAQAAAQGFAGLGKTAEGYREVAAGVPIVFPRDRGAHPDFRIEWWYLTANLTASDGRRFGAQWTLFRAALTPESLVEGWSSRQVWMGHAAVTSEKTHRFAEKFARGGVGQSGVSAAPFAAWIDDWELAAADSDGASDELAVSASGDGFGYRLRLTGAMTPVLHGDAGYSVKTESGKASYYYSRPFLQAEGTLRLDGTEIAVSGNAWLDREWSSQPLDARQGGWDWAAIHFDSGEKLMVFRVRVNDGGDFRSGTWIARDGSAEEIAASDIRLAPLDRHVVGGRTLPLRWRLSIPSRALDVELSPLNPDSWMGTYFPYWEGPVTVTGNRPGQGYLEMTGY